MPRSAVFPLIGLILLGTAACSADPREDSPASGGNGASASPPAASPPPSSPPSASSPSPPPAGDFPFTDITAWSGLAFEHDNGAEGRRHYVETMGPGVALFDADGDGDLDVYVVDGGPLPGGRERQAPGNRLFLNRGDATFEAVADSGADDRGYGMGVTVGDVDGDGDRDLYVLNYGPNALYLNDGQGRFSRAESGAEDPTWSVSGAFFDADTDGDLDLYVANYLEYDVAKEKPCRAGTLEIYCSPEQFPPIADRLYENQGGGRFADISAKAGVASDGRGMGVVASDLDGDADVDLYVANDRSANLLYTNEGGRLTDVAAETGAGYSPIGQPEGGMGVVAADLTGDGNAAIFVTNFQKEPNRLYRASGDLFFDDLTNKSGLGFASSELVGWGVDAFDVEGDGDLDLAVANGHVFDNAAEFIPGSAFALPDHLYLNGGEGRFELTPFPGTPLSSRGLASGDLDGDGDRDLVIAASHGPLRVWRNDAGVARRFLVVELVGRSPNTDAYGAALVARAAGRELRREVVGGGSYASHNDTRLELGLGTAVAVDEITVRWSDGSVEKASGLAAGQRVVWRQGEGVVEKHPLGGGR